MRAIGHEILKLARLWLGAFAVCGTLLAESTPDPDLQRGVAQLSAGHPGPALEALERYALRCRCAEGEFLRGRALLELERPQSALEAFGKALERDPHHLPARLHTALALERLGRWDEAASQLGRTLATPELQDSLRHALEARVAADRERQRLVRDGARLPAPRRLSDKVNSPADDFMPLLSLDGLRLCFTSNRSGGLDLVGRAGVFREDFWSSLRAATGEWGSARLLEPPFNTPVSEGSGSYSADGRLFVFSACGRPGGSGDCDLFLSRWNGVAWTLPLALEKVNGPGWDSQPALAPAGDWLLFASDRPGGLGGRDLWISRLEADGHYGDPRNAGSVLNTRGNEAGPFLHADGHSLYYSSDGLVGFGGLDLFYSRLREDGVWTLPVNLGPPFSTPEPDLGLCLSGDGKAALFSSRREGRPDLDLYESQVPLCCPPEAVILLTGKVLENGSNQPLAARVRLESLERDEGWQERRCDADGLFSFTPGTGRHLLFADAPGHLFACLAVECVPPGPPPSRVADFQVHSGRDTLLLRLDPLAPGAHLSLPRVRFAFNSAELGPESSAVLEPVCTWLKENPASRVELRGHTDSVGGEAYNQALSLRRAEIVKAWLVSCGVPEMQITTVGAGQVEPLSREDNEAARMANRRTELWLR